jgi:GNAT superfamily N-acetyltransferase
MTITIRAVAPGEVIQLPAIERDAAARFREVGLSAIAEGHVSDEAFIRSILRSGVAIGAASGTDGLVGFALAGVLDDALHIYELSVTAAFGGRGVGSSILAALEERAHDRGLSALTLSTFADVPWNGPFYARRGFSAVGNDDWTPAFHLLHVAEHAAGLPLDRRMFMRKELA